MTAADRAAFSSIFARVCRTFNRPFSADVAADYFTALERVPLPELEAAADDLVRSSRFFPKPVDWLTAAQKARKPSHFARFAPTVVTLPDGRAEITYHCLRCQDTGWRPDCGCEFGRLDYRHRCPAHPFERNGCAYARPVLPCECRAHNPAWLRKYDTSYVPATATGTWGAS